MNKLKILTLTTLLALVLTGCGMNAEKLADEMIAAMEGKQLTQATATMTMEMNMEAEGESMDMKMDMAMDIKASSEPYASYMDMKTTVDVAGQQTEETTQAYSLEEDGALVNYVHTDSTDKWEKQDLGMSLEDMTAQTVNLDWMKEKAAAEEITLEEETQTVGDTEVYVMNCTLEGAELEAALGGMSGVTDVLSQAGMEAADFGALNIPTTYYVDKETFLPVKMDMTIEGMDEMMDAVLADMLGANESGIEFDMNVGAIHAVYENMSYDPVEVPTVPEEGLMIANQASFNPDMGDGTYVIQESGDVMKITPPDGWKAIDMGYDTVTLQKDDKKSSVVFTMHTNVETGLAFRNYVERGDVLTLLQEGNYDSHGSSELKSDYSGMWLKAADGTNYYYAWTGTGERCFLFVKMTDKGSFDRNKIDSVVPFAEEIELKSLYE